MKLKNVLNSLETFNGLRKQDTAPVFTALVNDSGVVIEMYGPIGRSMWEDGVTASQVSEALKGPESNATVRINSPGGSVFEGVAIYNLLKSSGKQIHVVVDGVAASAASLIAMAGHTISMCEGTMLMIHPAQAMTAGTAADLRQLASLLDKVTANMADIYAGRSGQTLADVQTMMAAETWMSSEDAVNLGFADEATGISEDAQQKISALAAQYDLSSLYEKTPEALCVFTKPTTTVEPEPVTPELLPNAAWARRNLELMDFSD